jgi:hypothetical protein
MAAGPRRAAARARRITRGRSKAERRVWRNRARFKDERRRTVSAPAAMTI